MVAKNTTIATVINMDKKGLKNLKSRLESMLDDNLEAILKKDRYNPDSLAKSYFDFADNAKGKFPIEIIQDTETAVVHVRDAVVIIKNIIDKIDMIIKK